MTQITTLQRLASELVRVTRLQHVYEDCRCISGANVEPVIAMIDAALERAIVSLGSGNAMEVVRTIRELEAFKE